MPGSAPASEAAEPCPTCGEVGRRTHLAVREFSLVECSRCGLVSTLPTLPPEAMGAYYPPTYYGEQNRRFLPLLERLIPWFRGRRATAIERLADRRGSLLDVGCGRGVLPALLRERGWAAEGLENDPISRGPTSEMATPLLPARPVRPVRWM